MKKEKPTQVIAAKYLPTRPPIIGSIVWWWLLERLHAPGWVWGAAGVLAAFVWTAIIYSLVTQQAVHPFQIDLPQEGKK